MYLALVVVLDHLQTHLLTRLGVPFIPPNAKLGMNAGFAVIFFFAISGFLMSYVLTRKYDPTTIGTLAFYRARFIRIFSLYWPMLVVLLIISGQTRAAFLDGQWPDVFCHIFLFGTDLQLSFPDYPTVHEGAFVPYLQQAWSLGPELTFYALAPFILRRPFVLTLVLAASVTLRTYLAAVESTGFDAALRYHFFGSTICFFVMGHLARVAGDRLGWLAKGSIAGVLLAVCVGAMVLPIGGPFVDWDSARFWLAISAFALCLPGVFAATKDWRWSNFLGDLSFGVYLVNTGVIRGAASSAFLVDGLHKYGPMGAFSPYALSAMFVVCIIALAYLVHRFIEKPTADLMRRATVPVRFAAKSVPVS